MRSQTLKNIVVVSNGHTPFAWNAAKSLATNVPVKRDSKVKSGGTLTVQCEE
jgi:hypothetical protein